MPWEAVPGLWQGLGQCPPLAEGGHGLEWLKGMPPQRMGFVGLLPSHLEKPRWPRARSGGS